MTDPRRLLLLRHAKSSWDDPSLADRDRPLNSRGRRAATTMGQYLRDHDLAPDLVLCSSAARTRETLERLDLGTAARVLIEDDLYAADASDLFARLRRAPPDAAMVLLIGHNPGVHELAIMLTGDVERPPAFPTGALAVVRVPAPAWTDLAVGGNALEDFVAPRDLDRRR